jgi:hypothetical protein
LPATSPTTCRPRQQPHTRHVTTCLPCHPVRGGGVISRHRGAHVLLGLRGRPRHCIG